MVATREEEILGRPFRGGTKQIEYRVEPVPFGEQPTKHLPELLERLNELGKDGWRVVSVDLADHPVIGGGPSPNPTLLVLLAREVSEVPSSPFQSRPTHLEYRAERLPVAGSFGSPAHLADMLERLNELGRQGWLVVSVDLTDPRKYEHECMPPKEPRLTVLMEREVEE